MWNLRNKTNEQMEEKKTKKNGHLCMKNKLLVDRGGWGGGVQ